MLHLLNHVIVYTNFFMNETQSTVELQSLDKQLDINQLHVGVSLEGIVKNIELYGAFVDIGLEIDALLHISQLGKPNIRNVADIVKTGDKVTVYVIKIHHENNRIALSLVKPVANPISNLRVGDVVKGKVIRIEKFGVFIDIESDRPGMIHISELATHYVRSPEDIVQLNQDIQAKIIKVNHKKRQIDLSVKQLDKDREQQLIDTIIEEDEESIQTSMELALRQAMQKNKSQNSDHRSLQDKRSKNSHKQLKALDKALLRTLKDVT